MLEVLKELEIYGDPAALDAFVEAASRDLPTGWSRYLEGERRLRERALVGDAPQFWFRCDAAGDRPPADLFLVRLADRYRVTNIVPQQVGKLTRPQYNAILDEFASVVACPVADSLGLKVHVSRDRRPITDWLSDEAARRLKQFSVAANKGTGSSNPHDFNRWAAFLVQAHRDQARLDAGTLRRWLVEEEGWPEETASDLVGEFEFARDLLAAYDNGHR